MGPLPAKPPLLHRLLHALGRPVLSYFDRRFEDLKVSTQASSLQVIEDLKFSTQASGLQVITEVSRDTDTISELTLSIERLASRYGVRIDTTVEALDRLLDIAGQTLAAGSPDSAARQLVGRPLTSLGPGTSALLNWAASPDGPSAQAGAWVRPVVEVEHGLGRVDVTGVTSLVVEAPIAHAVALRLPPGSRILVLGAAGSVLALELASLGFHVTALDPGGVPDLHPNVEVVVEQPPSWRGPSQPFDAVFYLSAFDLSAVERVTAPHDSVPRGTVAKNTVVRTLGLVRSWLSPTGELLMSVPFGCPVAGDRFCVFDATGIDELFGNWTVRERQLFEHRHPLVWEPRADERWPAPATSAQPGLAIVHASPRE